MTVRDPTARPNAELDAWAALQHQLVQDIQRARSLDKSEAVVARAQSVLTGNDRCSPVEQLEIYRQQFWLRHTSALLEDFPGVSGILGQTHWEPVVESYLVNYPPDSWTLRDVGSRFAQHLANCSELPHRALCVDMARLEWAYTEVFDAPASCRLDPLKLAAIPDAAWDHVRVLFNPGLRLLRVDYPVARLRKQLRDAATHGDPTPVAIPAPSPQNLVLYRDTAYALCFSAIDDVSAALIEALRSGQRLLEACETAARGAADSAALIEASLGRWFHAWGAKGWIVDVAPDDC